MCNERSVCEYGGRMQMAISFCERQQTETTRETKPNLLLRARMDVQAIVD